LTSVLSMGVLTRAELAELGNPPMAGILASVVGPWGAALINFGVILSLAGALLGWTIIAADCPYSAAKTGVFTKNFARENKNGSPSFSLFATNGIIQLFLIVIYFNDSTYQAFYNISASMIMIPYLFSALYYLKVTIKKEGFESASGSTLLTAKIFAVMGTVYGVWLLYSSGLISALATSLLYAPGILVYIYGKKEKNQPYLDNTKDRVIAAALVGFAIISVVLIAKGVYNPF